MEIDEGGVIEQTTINKRTHIMDMINEKGLQSAYCNDWQCLDFTIKTIIKKLGTRRYIISVLMDDTLVIQQSEGGIVVCA